MSNQDREVKLRAITALQGTGSLGAPDLERAAEDEDEVVRTAALNALEQIKSPRRPEAPLEDGHRDPEPATTEDLKSVDPRTP